MDGTVDAAADGPVDGAPDGAVLTAPVGAALLAVPPGVVPPSPVRPHRKPAAVPPATRVKAATAGASQRVNGR